MSRKPTSEHGGKEVFDFRIHIILIEPHICLSQACIVRARGFLWGTTSEAVCTFFSDSQVDPPPMFSFSFQTCILLFYLDIQVEAVHFLDPLHGECYVELKSKEDLARALDKHALRVAIHVWKH